MQVPIEKFTPTGFALGTLQDPTSPDNGKKIFLWNALPGETVTDFQILKKKSSYLTAVATSFENPSPSRVKPRDPCFLATSPWQILSYSEELAEKRLLVSESLAQAHVSLSENVPVEPVQTDGREWFYRNKMEYSLYWDNSDQRIHLAFHARGSHQKLPLKPKKDGSSPSSLERPEIAAAATKILADLNARHEPAYKYQSLLLRADQRGTVSGGLFEKNRPHPVLDNLSDTLLGETYSYSPNGFFQINLPVYELALKEIKNHIKTDSVLDLYSGVGTIGLSVARDHDLTLVECDHSAFGELVVNSKIVTLPESFELHKENPRISGGVHERTQSVAGVTRTALRSARLNDDGNPTGFSATKKTVTPVFSKSEFALDYISPSQTVILDPPRAGCDKRLIDRLLSVRPEVIIYLSCNPTTQARDVAYLTENGVYDIKKVAPFNFFPKTPHIENLIVLEKLR